ncbi:MAG: hypothetical protein ACK5AO_01620 [bacterium]|jgi:chromosome segregation ATPase
MADANDHIKRIEEKLAALSLRIRSLKKENEKMRKELEEKTNECDLAINTAKQMELKLNVVKSNESNESKESRTALEKKINDYIKEIDKCIALLGDRS